MCGCVCVPVYACVCVCVSMCGGWGWGIGLVSSPGWLFGCPGLGWAGLDGGLLAGWIGLENWDGDGVQTQNMQLLLRLPILVLKLPVMVETSI